MLRRGAGVARGAGRRSRGSRTDPAGARRRRRATLDLTLDARRARRRAVLVVATAEHVRAPSLRACRDAGPQAAGRRWRARPRPALCGRRPRTSTCRSSACWPPAAACRRGCTARRRSGRACWSCAASPSRSAASPPTGPGCAPPRTTSSASIVKLQAARERTEPDALGAADAAVCPYKGLASFEAGDAGFFFGRERFVAELVARVTGAPFLGIVGPSGSGKSSALHAGLLAALAAGVLPGSEALGARRVASRGASAARARAGARRGARPRPAGRGGRPVRGGVHDLPRRVGARGVRRRARGLACETRAGARWWSSPCAPTSTVAAPPTRSCRGSWAPATCSSARCSADELRRAIELPARRAGLLVERELVDALLADVEGQPGALPLVSSALLELWQRRDGRALRLVRLRAGRGRARRGRAAGRAGLRAARPRGPAARPAGPAAAGRRGRGRRRRAAPRPAEPSSRATPSRRSWTCSPTARLITISEGEVEVAHEALLREWPRLRDVARGGRRRTPAAPAPHARRPRLAIGRPRPGGALPGRPPGFRARLDRAARARAGRARARVRRREPRRGGAGGRAPAACESSPAASCWPDVGALLALAVVAGAVAVSQRGQAREAAVTRRRAARRRRGARPRAPRPGAAARARRRGAHDSAATRGNLLSVLMRNPAVLGVLHGDGWPSHLRGVSPDGRLVAIGGIAARSRSSTPPAAGRSGGPTGSRTATSARSSSRPTERRSP